MLSLGYKSDVLLAGPQLTKSVRPKNDNRYCTLCTTVGERSGGVRVFYLCNSRRAAAWDFLSGNGPTQHVGENESKDARVRGHAIFDRQRGREGRGFGAGEARISFGGIPAGFEPVQEGGLLFSRFFISRHCRSVQQHVS